MSDVLSKANKMFEQRAYVQCGIDVDNLSDAEARAALKAVLGKAACKGAMSYLCAAKDAIEKQEG